ncbi:VWA domain-containing protein [Tessaracoccus sp. OH4464_COT-324]|uniref:VWA domain-containing protein n=1 Tax=Tessaracoccus sp. OH4464_COT-324 TaxID=2491059 RepID=UPI000F6312F1|nr:VWA domain-containing protein [Tessaracoccus sp. OH4464_COT-324]RRD47323.1 VWA domain-containing protein [Tessaracoccus sp. OH4464_COT-324]
MRKRILAGLAAAAVALTAGLGVARADDGSVSVEVKKPAEGAVAEAGKPVELGGVASAGGGGQDWNVVMVLDASGSTLDVVNQKSIFEWEQVGAKALMKSLQASTSEINQGVVYFGSGKAGFGMTKDSAQVDQWLSLGYRSPELSGVTGSTACEYGVQAARELLKNTTGNKRVYFLTDGRCNGSTSTLAKEVQQAAAENIEVFSIHTTAASSQCKNDQLKGKSCIYAEDPSTLAGVLPGGSATLETLQVLVEDDKGKEVTKVSFDAEVSGKLVYNWTTQLPALPAGKYKVTASATAKGVNQPAVHSITFTVSHTPVPQPSASPKPSMSPKPSPSMSPKPSVTPSATPSVTAQPGPQRPKLPKTGC